MSWMRRFANLFRRGRLERELEEELAAHIEEAVERGRTVEEARRSFGGALQHREASRDIKLLPWLDSLASDLVFGWRQLQKHRSASAAAILSLALAIGATTAAFRLVDAMLLRKLPVAEPDRLYYLAVTYIDRDGRPNYRDDFDYPTFRQQVKTAGNLADLMVLGMSYAQEALFDGSDQIEKPYRQFVSGNVFGVLGLQPALGRLLTPNDDAAGRNPVAVLSYEFWKRRFGRDPNVIGKKFRQGRARYEIVGVGPEGYTGTEPGLITDIFVPATMNTEALNAYGWSWFRTWMRPKPGVTAEQVRQRLDAALAIENRERMASLDKDTPKQVRDAYQNQSMVMFPASSGASDLKKEYRRPLLILGLLVVFVLLIACANVGNLLSAQAASRAREMALRVSIGAGQWRLIQLVLVESALLAAMGSVLGAVFAWWAAPMVVGMLANGDDPVRLALTVDWRVLSFGCALELTITVLFGLAPALRASTVKPINALRGGDGHGSRRLMNSLVAAQVAFCVLVLFVAGLLVSTFARLSTRPLGFSTDRMLVVEAGVRGKGLPAETWRLVEDQLGQTPGVESVGAAGWAPLSGNHWSFRVLVPGRASELRSPYFVDVMPTYFEALRIGWIDGRRFRAGDAPPAMKADKQPLAGVGIVNEAFARAYFDGQNPVGKLVAVRVGKDVSAQMEIVGYVRSACYGNLREPMQPTVYVPVAERSQMTFLVRTSGDPRAMAPILRREVSRARPGILVRNVGVQAELVSRQLIRERMLATLSLFFAVVALVLAAIGLYGVLNYSVIRQRREIGIRMALGARSAHVVGRIAASVFAMVTFGGVVGLALGVAGARFIEAMLYEVRATDSGMVAAPVVTLIVAAMVAAAPPALRAVRIDPAETLRSE